MKFTSKKGRSIKNQFVLSVGDEGAIFCHFDDGKLQNKLFIDTPASPDVKLIEKLMITYPKTPVSLLVDSIEQNYSQQVLPPVSSFGIRQQISRRLKRDFQPNDLNNVLFLDRTKEGRKDWNFLFISLANSDPFAKWLELILNQLNPFKGVYLLPLESTKLIEDVNKSGLESSTREWELLVLHNKVGGFRIVAFKDGKLIFTRLAQNLIGDNIPDIIVGNMEQEISNTIEYLRRLTFKGEAESKITIIAGAEILEKVDRKNLKFGSVELFTPYQVAQRLSLGEAVTERDKFADILLATHFASVSAHVLKFTSPYTKKLDTMYQSIRAAYVAFALGLLAIIGFSADTGFQISEDLQEREDTKAKLNQVYKKQQVIVQKMADLKKLNNNLDRMLDVMTLSHAFEGDKYKALRIINVISPAFNNSRIVTDFGYTIAAADKKTLHFQLDIDMNFIIHGRDQDQLNSISDAFLKEVGKLVPKYKVTWSNAPRIGDETKFEQVIGGSNMNHVQDVTVPAKISIAGEF